MDTYKPGEGDFTKLRRAADQLREANRSFAIAKRLSEAAKQVLADWLKDERSVDVDKLELGTVINIDGIVLVKVKGQWRLDQKQLGLARPDVLKEFTKEFPTVYWDPV